MDSAVDKLRARGEYPWVVFRIFCGYRLLIAATALIVPHLWATSLTRFETTAFRDMLAVYVVILLTGFLVSFFWKKRFYTQLTAHVLLDVCVLHVFMILLGGMKSGLGLLLLVSVAGASLMATGKLALLYAAMASIFLLATQYFLLVNESATQDFGSAFLEAGILGMGFFLAAALAYALSLRFARTEREARQRQIERDNQIAISQRVMERIADGLIVATPDGAVLESNLRAREFLGDALTPGTWLALLNPELAEAYQTWRAAPHAQDRLQVAFRHGNHAFSAHFSETLSADGASLILFEDSEQLLRTAQQMKLAALGRLTASIAHEIRNPLSAIRHAVELLSESIQEGTEARLCSIVHDNAERIGNTVGDILSLGRAQTEPLSRIDLKAWLENFRREFLETHPGDPARFALIVNEGATLLFDPEQLRRILWNLVDNALRHASAQPGALYISVEEDGPRTAIHVVDDGPGIAPEIAQQVFEPFFTTNARGTGLGLFIARELAEANDAQLALRPGLGGHFILSGKP